MSHVTDVGRVRQQLLFLLAQAHSAHVWIAERAVLVEAAGGIGHYRVGVLLEIILTDEVVC